MAQEVTAQEATEKETPKPWPGYDYPIDHWQQAVIPNESPIDKIGALVLVERRKQQSFKRIMLFSYPQCPAEKMEEWRRKGVLPIDIGEEKYNQMEEVGGSAAEITALKLGLELTSAERDVLAMLARNNETGYLKGQPHSIPWMMRELYALDSYGPVEVISRVSHVAEVYLAVEEAKEGDLEEWNEEWLPDLCAKVKNSNFAPLTTGRYLKDLAMLGFEREEIEESVGWWVRAWELLRAMYAAAQDQFKTLSWEGKEYFIGDNRLCRLLDTDDPFVVKVAARSCDVLVARRSSGLVGVLTRQGNLDAFAEALVRMEPVHWSGRKAQGPIVWYYQQKAGCLVNGGRQYPKTTPTSLTPHELAVILCDHPPQFSHPERKENDKK